jgi:hypothetical protein
MNHRTVADLLDHATRQIGDVIGRCEALFDDQEEETLFMLTLFGRFLAIPAQRLVAGDERVPDAEATLTACVVLLTLIHGHTVINNLDQDRIGRRGRALSRKVEAAAGKL